MIKLVKKFVYFFKRIFFDYEIDYIQGSETLPPPLEKEEEERLLLEFGQGSIEARNTLLKHNLRLVVYLAKRYDTNINNLEDLISIGTIGLVKAINTYKPEKNIKLATYASRCIENEILMHLRKMSRTNREVSIDEPLNVDYDGNELLLSDIIGSEDTNFVADIEEDEKRQRMMKAICELKPREKQILIMRFGLETGDEMTQKDVADILGISQSYISRLEKRIIKKLQAKLNK